MDSRWPAVAVASAGLAASLVAGALAPGHEAVCGPDDFECWDPYATTARMASWSLGLALAGALFAALARRRLADLLAAPLAFAGGFWTFLGTVFSSPGSRNVCGHALCPDPALVATLLSLPWGLAVASLLLHALRAPPRRGATVVAGATLGLLPPGIGLVFTGYGGAVEAAGYAMVGAAAAGALVAWGLLRRPGRESA